MTRLVNSITSAEEIRRLVQELYAAWSLHQLEKIDAIFTRDAAYEDVAAGQVHRSAEEIKQLLRATYAWAPDFRITMKSLIVADDCAATEWLSEGIQTGPIGDSVTDYYDMATFLTQLGGPPNRLASASPTERTS